MWDWLKKIFKDIEPNVKESFTAILAELVNGCYLILWAALQFLVAKIIGRMELTGIDVWVFLVFQILFGVSTVIATVIYIYRDTKKLWIRSNKEIEQERSKE